MVKTKTPAKKRTKANPIPATEGSGIDTTPEPVVQSGFSAFNPTIPEGTPMNEEVKPDTAAAEKEAAKAAKAAQLATEKEAAYQKRVAAIAARDAKTAEAAKAKAEKVAARKAATAEKLAAGSDGAMAALRAAKDRYVVGANGRMRSSDDIALLFDAVEPVDVIAICMQALSITIDPYPLLNVGQKSMNLRNKLRGAVRKGAVSMGHLRSLIDVHPATPKEVKVSKAKAKVGAPQAAA